jgi:hypothetical protein
MLRTNGPDNASFRASNWTSFAPGAAGEGEVVNPGRDFTLLKITNASHFVRASRRSDGTQCG